LFVELSLILQYPWTSDLEIEVMVDDADEGTSGTVVVTSQVSCVVM